MLQEDGITISMQIQGFAFKGEDFNPITGETTLCFESTLPTSEVFCPHCGGKVYVWDYSVTTLKDMPFFVFCKHSLKLRHHRYMCTKCKCSFTEKLRIQHPETRITTRAARWIKLLLTLNMSVSSLAKLTGIHWDTIRKVYQQYMDVCLEKRKQEWEKTGYKPKYLAVDEFALRKGQEYATCVMDLETGEVLWVGEGRAMKDFIHFFEDMEKDFLSEVKAVAMDMHASYNNLVKEYLPYADIVYDRYHMLSNYGRSVLSKVRIEEANIHRQNAENLQALRAAETDPVVKTELKAKAKEQTHIGATIKSARWLVLKNSANLATDGQQTLQTILDSHEKLAVCYAMKEEMNSLFRLRNVEAAREGWTAWFEGAKASEIKQLRKFAELKESRIDGLVAHAKHGISTGKLEGFNNRIKTIKRTAYGYRDMRYLFTLIRYISLPFHDKP